jgi:hypothetical protein
MARLSADGREAVNTALELYGCIERGEEQTTRAWQLQERHKEVQNRAGITPEDRRILARMKDAYWR